MYLDREYRGQIPWLDDAAAAAVSVVDALENFYHHDRQLLRLKCSRLTLLTRLSGWLNLALAERRIIDLYAADVVRKDGRLKLAVSGRHQTRHLLLADIRRKEGMSPMPEAVRYKLNLQVILERKQYQLDWGIPDEDLDAALAPELYCRMKEAEFIRGAEAAHFHIPQRKIRWK